MPINRVGNHQMNRQLMYSIQNQLGQQQRLYEQISTNKKLLRPSDDPVGAGKALHYRDEVHRLKDYEDQASAGTLWTNTTAVALDGLGETWRRVNEIAISAADGSKSAEDRRGMSIEIDQLLQHVVQIGNSAHAGKYIFAGNHTDEPAFRTETDSNTGKITGVFYDGDSGPRNVKTNDHTTRQVNVLGSDGGNPEQTGVFMDSVSGVNLFNTLIDLRDQLENNDVGQFTGSGGMLDRIEKGVDNIASAQTRLGGVQEALTLDRNRILEQGSSVEQFLSDVEDADIAELIMELNEAQNVYEAALAAGGRLFQTSLLNFI